MNVSNSKGRAQPFCKGNLESRLLMVDEDMKLEALKHTNYIKPALGG